MVDATASQLAQRGNITSMPLRPSGTGVLMLDGESVCISSAQGDDAESHSTDAKFWCGMSSGEVATVRSVLSAHGKFGSFSMYLAPMANRWPADCKFWCGMSSGEVATVRSVLRAHDKFGSFSMYSAPRAKRCPAELLSSRCIPLLLSTAMAMSRGVIQTRPKKIVKGIFKKNKKRKKLHYPVL
jgi:hypothetical protein